MDVGQVYYNADTQWILNIVLAAMILGVALDIHWRDFRALVKFPKVILFGLVAQFLLLPATTAFLTLYLDLPAGIELGMILVAACPGGAISNFVTHLSGGNTALSISMTAVASALATVLMPLNFLFWASVNNNTSELLQAIQLDSITLFKNLLLVLALPLIVGLTIKRHFHKVASLLHNLLKYVSIFALVAFILIAIVKNHQAFLSQFWLIFGIVLVHNSVAFLLGFLSAKIAQSQVRDTKAVTIEVGMQNSSLAIAIVFSQFSGEAGMALISAFWGTWHIVSGLMLAGCFRHWGKYQPIPHNQLV